MDIIFARSLFTPHDLSGSRYPWEVSRHLAARGHHVRVVTPRPTGPLPTTPNLSQIIPYPVSRRTPLETFITNALFSAIEIGREVRRRRPDIIVTSSYEVAFGNVVSPMARRVPNVFIYNSSFYSDAVDRLAARPLPWRLAHRALKAFMRRVELLTFRSADALVAVSPYSQLQMLDRLDGTHKQIDVVPTGVDPTEFYPSDRAGARSQLGLPADATVLLAVGRLARVKRFDRAIAAVEILRRQRPDVMLVIAGKGPEAAALRRQAVQLGQAVRFAGFLAPEALLAHYRAADAVLCTSEFENWSVSILEAFACGVPVFGTPRGSIPDLLGLVDDGLVLPSVEPGDIARLLVERLEARWLADVGARARAEVVARFSWERTAERLAGVFQKTITAHASGT